VIFGPVATLRNIRQSLLWAFAYEVLGVPSQRRLYPALGLPSPPTIASARMSFELGCR